jgi:hypothetical protein
MPSNVLVSGLSDTQYNGLYVYDGDINGRPSYRLNEYVSILFDNTAPAWLLEDMSPGKGGDGLYAASDVAYPWLVTNWGDNGVDPTGVVMTEVPVSSQPTYGLPAGVVDLLTARFGSVANFLRLKNQGQI